MKMGINYAAEVLHKNIRDLIQSSNCPAVVVRSVLEHELAAVQSWEDQEIAREQQQFQKELEREKTEEKRGLNNGADNAARHDNKD